MYITLNKGEARAATRGCVPFTDARMRGAGSCQRPVGLRLFGMAGLLRCLYFQCMLM